MEISPLWHHSYLSQTTIYPLSRHLYYVSCLMCSKSNSDGYKPYVSGWSMALQNWSYIHLDCLCELMPEGHPRQTSPLKSSLQCFNYPYWCHISIVYKYQVAFRNRFAVTHLWNECLPVAMVTQKADPNTTELPSTTLPQFQGYF